MSLSYEQQEFTKHVSLLMVYATSIGIELTFGEAYRTKEQQEIYFNTGKSHTRNSNHLRRLAIDFNFFIEGKLSYDHPQLEELGVFWESLDPKNRWGGNFQSFYDSPHFERNV